MRVKVNRNSVAMGDDAVDHERLVDVPDDASLDQLFRLTAPDVSVTGGSTWICEWNGVPVAVHCSGWGTGRVWDDRFAVPADLPGGTMAEPSLVHRYWSRMDADWLLAQLRAGARLDRRALTERWAPMAAARREQGLRERELSTTERLLDPSTVATLEGFGARIDLHADRTCRFVLDSAIVAPGKAECAGVWTVQLVDTMTMIRSPHHRAGSVRPVVLASPWLTAMVGAAVTGVGTDALPAAIVDSTLRRPPARGGPWTVTRRVGQRQELAQLPDEAHAEWFRRTLGRSVVEVAAAYHKHCSVEEVAPGAASRPAAIQGLGRPTSGLGAWVRSLFDRRG